MTEKQDAAPTPSLARVRPLLGRIVGLSILVAAAGLTIYVIHYLNHSLRTDDAFVRADTIGVAPQVSGRIIRLPVRDNQPVKKGDVLFELDSLPYQYSLARARAALDAQEKQIGLQQRDVDAQKFGASAAKANIARAQAQARQAADTLDRLEPLLSKEYITAEQLDQARTARLSADAALLMARGDAARAEAAVGSVDAVVARLGELRAAVAMAEYDLDQTVVRASFDGTVVDLNIAEGEYASTGKPLFTLIDTEKWYVMANFRETELNRIRPGMTAEVFILADPSRRFTGTVQSISSGVYPEEGGGSTGGLPKVPRSINWVRVAQRFPVRIRIDNPQADLFRIGASAVALISPEGERTKTTSAR